MKRTPAQTPLDALQLAIDACDGQAELARLIGGKVKPQHVWNWINRDHCVPAEHCRAIERIAEERGAKVTRYDLRPDVFGESREAA